MSDRKSLATELDEVLASNTDADPGTVAAARELLAELARCPAHACPHPAGHTGMHQTDWQLSPLCGCGHRQYLHDSTVRRCRWESGYQRCHCQQFTKKGEK